MSKELPYFRFYPSEWLEGNITLENEKTQGFFITLLSWYWKKDCQIDISFVNKRLINGKASLKQCLNSLIDANIIKLDDNQNITIDFLDEQLDILTEKRNKLVEAGRKGGKASVKHRSSYKDNNKYNNVYNDIDFANLTHEEKAELGKAKLNYILNDCMVWLENVAMQNNMSQKAIKEKFVGFGREIQLRMDFNKSIKDIQGHFVNWLKKNK